MHLCKLNSEWSTCHEKYSLADQNPSKIKLLQEAEKKKLKEKKKEENRKEAPMTAFPKTLIHFNRKSRAALQWKVETDRKTRIKYGKMWKITLKNLIQFTDAAHNKLWDEELQLHSYYRPQIFGIISCLNLRAARSSGVQTPFLKFTFYINSLQVFFQFSKQHCSC